MTPSEMIPEPETYVGSTYQRSRQFGEIAGAVAKVQAELKNPKKDQTANVTSNRTGQKFSYSYMDLASVLEACREPFAKQGLALFQPVLVEENGKVMVTTLLAHSSGQWMQADLALTTVDTTPQGIGSAITYGRRYGLTAMIGIAGEDDDDGERASGDRDDRQQNGHKCPQCGKALRLSKDRPEWYCWQKQGGCGATFPKGEDGKPVFSTQAPEQKPPANGKPQTAAPESQNTETVPPIVIKMWQRMGTLQAIVKVFEELKRDLYEVLGEDAGKACYYSVLKHHGVEHANLFRKPQPARTAAWDLYKAIADAREQAANQRAAEGEYQATDEDLPDVMRQRPV